MQKMMTKKRFAKYLGVSIKTVDRSIKKGMPALRIMSAIRIPLDDAVLWMAENNKTNRKNDI